MQSAAPDASNPYWQDPSVEPLRVARTSALIPKYVPNLDNLLLVAFKSWNDNLVLYEYNPHATSVEEMVTTSWLSLEPAQMAHHVRNNNPSLRSPLSVMENTLFGIDVRRVADGRYLVNLRHPAVNDRVFELVTNSEGQTVALGTVDGHACVMRHAYIQMKQGVIPLVQYLNLVGVDVQDGTLREERVLPRM